MRSSIHHLPGAKVGDMRCTCASCMIERQKNLPRNRYRPRARKFTYVVTVEVEFPGDDHDRYDFAADFVCRTEEPEAEVDAVQDQLLGIVERAVREFRENA